MKSRLFLTLFLFCAVSLSLARAQSGFVDDTPAPAAPASQKTAASASLTSKQATPAKPALANIPGLILPDSNMPGMIMTPELQQRSINSVVANLSSQLSLSSYQQSQIQNILTTNLGKVSAISSNTEENPTIAANEKAELYQRTFNELNNVLTTQQKQNLQKIMAPMQAAHRVTSTPAPQ